MNRITIGPINQVLDRCLPIIKRFIPERNISPSVGLDIGIGSCKLIELVKSSSSYELLTCAIKPMEKGDVPGTIKKILAHLKVPTKSLFTAVFGKGTLIRYIDMPRMSLEELKKSFLVEADKYFPFPKDQIYMDCYILDPNGSDKKMSVLVAVTKKEIIDERIKLLTDLGLQTNFIGINSVALANAFNVLSVSRNASTLNESSVIAILDLGDAVSHLMILINHLPRFNRDIFVGGRHLTQEISSGLGVSLQEAEVLKCQPGNRAQEILNACESNLTNLVSNLRLSFDYFITEKNIQISKLLLTGGASLFEGLDGFLAKNLEMPVEKWDPIPSLKLTPDISIEELRKNACKLGVALGLALYQ